MKNTLEKLLDQHGLENLLTSLSEICLEKADHLRCNWQDEVVAKEWEKTSKTIDKVIPKLLYYCPLR